MWGSDSDSEGSVDRMFDPDYYNPADHEEEDSINIEGAMEFWGSDKKGTIIGNVFANSMKSLEEKESSASEPCELLEIIRFEIIRILIDKDNKTLSFIDNGVGMTKDELESFESSTGRGLLLVAHKVVVTTKQDGDDDEYVMVLSPGEDKKIVVATQEDSDLSSRGARRGTKITLSLIQDDEVEHLLEFPTYWVLAKKYLSTKIRYHVYIFSREGELVTVTGFNPNTNSLFEGSYHINNPVNYLDDYPLPRFVATSTSLVKRDTS